MEQMYQDYKDIVEFRLVYISEAHAADSERAVDYAVEKGINQHQDYGQRCTTAEMLMQDKSLTLPTLIDGMDNAVSTAYSADPDRIFVIRTDGRLAIVAARGPRGFAPALQETKQWLSPVQEDRQGTSPARRIEDNRRQKLC